MAIYGHAPEHGMMPLISPYSLVSAPLRTQPGTEPAVQLTTTLVWSVLSNLDLHTREDAHTWCERTPQRRDCMIHVNVAYIL